MIELGTASSVSKIITVSSVILLAAVTFFTAGSFFSGGVLAPMAPVQNAYAQEHGAGLTKVCNKIVVGSVDNCRMTAFNLDGFGDSLTITEICDTKNAPFPGAPDQKCFTLDPGFSIISFTNSSGMTTCAVGGSLPCVMGPGDTVRFRTQAHTMSTAGTFPDTAVVTTVDNCDGSPSGTASCPQDPQTTTAGSQQTVISPDIDVVKSLNTTKVTEGGAIEVTANVTNTGTVTLNGLTAVDTEAGALVCGDTTLSVGESTLCTGTFSPVADGTNTVTVEANHQLGQVSDSDSEDFTIIGADVDVVKSLNTTKVTEGGAIEVTANVTNTGNVELTGLTAVDTEAGTLTCNDTVLDPGESTLCTGTFNPVASGTNTVTATANFQLGEVSDSDSEDFTLINPGISVVKSLNTTKIVGGAIEVTANVTNIGDVELTSLTAVDSAAGALDCDDTTLSPDESTLCTGTFNPVASGTNTVTVEANHQLGQVSDTDSEDFGVINPDIDVVKSLNTTKVTEGGAIEVTANVTNTGTVTLNGLTAVDTEAGALVCGDTTLSVGESTLCTGTFSPVADGTNTVTVEANHQLGQVSDSDSEDFRVINPGITVEKTCDPETQTEPGTLTTIINTTNTGNVDLDVTVVDDVFGTLFAGTLGPGESNVTTIVQDNLPAGIYSNIVDATGEFQLGTVEDSDEATCEIAGGGAVFLKIDEDSIDNGIHFNRNGGPITPSGPNFFTKRDVNDDKPDEQQRDVLRFFDRNVGRTITVKTGQTGDEGWFAPTCIPQKWLFGLTGDEEEDNTCLEGADRDLAIDNFFGINGENNVPPQEVLDKTPHVEPLRAYGLNALVGKTVCAVVYDSDNSVNYDHDKDWLGVNDNMQGETLGIVAFEVISTATLNGFSSSTLPQVTITIVSTDECGNWTLFNAPVPESSSVPNDRIAPGSLAGYRDEFAQPDEDEFF